MKGSFSRFWLVFVVAFFAVGAAWVAPLAAQQSEPSAVESGPVATGNAQEYQETADPVDYDKNLTTEPIYKDPGSALVSLLTKKLMPNLPGLVLLLLSSFIFSTINFLSDLPKDYKPFRRAYWYLLIWIGVNYVISLTVLLLILPDQVAMVTWSKELLIYCLIATAIPEAGYNLRLQIGAKTSQSLNLHQYKVKVSKLIAQRLERMTGEERSRAIEAVSNLYTGKLEQFKDKLTLLSVEPGLKKEEREHLSEMLSEIEKKAKEKGRTSISSILQDHAILIPKLLDFFRKDIEGFLNSSAANLMNKLSPSLSIREANSLIKIGITSPWEFMLKTFFYFLRNRIARKSGIPEDRIHQIYHSTRGKQKLTLRTQLKTGLAFAVLALITINLAAVHGDRLKALPDYERPVTAKEIADEEKY